MKTATSGPLGQEQVTDPEQPITSAPLGVALAILRLGYGLTFLWAFFDKLFGWGYATKSADAWINGGSPTYGFLAFGAQGPFKDVYTSIAGAAWADVLFMVGLLGIGLALTAGVGMRVAGATGAILYVLMWTVSLPPENNPVLDDHLLGAMALVVLALSLAGDTAGLGRWWARTPLVRRWPALR